jgi:hypothetical protein
MQISRCLALACAAATILSPLLVRADDTEVQIRAREALEQQMNAQSVTSAPPRAVTKPAPVKPKPLPPAPAQKPTPQPVLVLESGVSQPAPVKPAPAAQPATKSAPYYTPYTPEPSSASANPETGAQLQQALQERMSQTQSHPQATEAPQGINYPWYPEKEKTPTAAVTQQMPTPAPMASSLPPMQGPPSSLSASKQQQLEQLLQQYRADQITPAQYHEQRAKILSGQ